MYQQMSFEKYIHCVTQTSIKIESITITKESAFMPPF